MSRGRRIAIAIGVLLVALIALNAVVLTSQTKNAEVTAEGGEILSLSGADVQVFDTPPETAGGPGAPIVLLHCFSCSSRWWDALVPLLDDRHRVVRIDLLGHGGSEKPSQGYAMEEQAAIVAEALNRLGVQGAVVVGHSMGAVVATALAAEYTELASKLVVIDQAASTEQGGLPFASRLVFVPVLGPALWRITPAPVWEQGLGDAFAPRFEVPGEYVDDLRAMTYTAFDSSLTEEEDYLDELPLDERIGQATVPLLAIFGSEEQIFDDPESALADYESVLGAQTELIEGAGHSPNVEAPEETAELILGFAEE